MPPPTIAPHFAPVRALRHEASPRKYPKSGGKERLIHAIPISASEKK